MEEALRDSQLIRSATHPSLERPGLAEVDVESPAGVAASILDLQSRSELPRSWSGVAYGVQERREVQELLFRRRGPRAAETEDQYHR
jgi:hypothetical protein